MKNMCMKNMYLRLFRAFACAALLCSLPVLLMGCGKKAPSGKTVCGDGVCEGDETALTCPEDCEDCGNGVCDPAEDAVSCPQDCGTCGNGVCDTGEDVNNCPADCTCGNGVCDTGEDLNSCPADCTCGNGVCDAGEDYSNCPADCTCGNGVCDTGEDYSNCPADCTCGNGVCDAGEDLNSCPADCTCGNGVCDTGEDYSNCPADCTCGNGVCDAGEDINTCPADCTCGNGVCDTGETELNCPQDCGCGNGVAETGLGEECDGFDFLGRTCLDENCTGGILMCNVDCTLNTSGCTGCQPNCGNGTVEGTEECDCGTDPQNLPAGCTAINGPPPALCDATCMWNANCGNGILEAGEACDCGIDPQNLPGGCTEINGGPQCTISCVIPVPCSGGDLFDACDPMDPNACCDDQNCNLTGYCETTAFTIDLCMMACTATPECWYNTLCFTGYDMCYPAYCGGGTRSLIGGQINAPCQVPAGGQGWCLPLGMAQEDFGICAEGGTQQHGDPCTEPDYIDITGLCRFDVNVQLCNMGICSRNTQTCIAACDPDDVYENNANSTYCPAGYNCWSYSYVDEVDPQDAGCRTADQALCVATEATDPTGGMTACDLTNGELIENRNQTCTDLDADYECVLVSYTSGISWGSRIGTCADTMQPPFLNVWDVCTAGVTCPPGSLCIEEDVFTAAPAGQTRCIPYCDTQNTATCNQQHSQLPVTNVCTSVSDLFTGMVCTETDPSLLGICACPSTGC